MIKTLLFFFYFLNLAPQKVQADPHIGEAINEIGEKRFELSKA